MKPDENKTTYWKFNKPAMGVEFWPVMVGHLQGFGQSHYINPCPNYFCPHVILSGRGTVRVNGRDFDVASGDMFSIWPGQAIEYFEQPGKPWQFIWVHLGGPGTEAFLEGCGFGSERLVLRPGDTGGVKRLFWQIHELCCTQDQAELPAIYASLFELVGVIRQAHRSADVQLTPQELVSQAEVYIDTMLNTATDINRIAADLAVSRTTLYRAFVKCKKITPIEYLSRRRIERAKELLEIPGLSIGEVAKAVGFNEQRYFSRCFKERTRQTPGQYQARHQK